MSFKKEKRKGNPKMKVIKQQLTGAISRTKLGNKSSTAQAEAFVNLLKKSTF